MVAREFTPPPSRVGPVLQYLRDRPTPLGEFTTKPKIKIPPAPVLWVSVVCCPGFLSFCFNIIIIPHFRLYFAANGRPTCLSYVSVNFYCRVNRLDSVPCSLTADVGWISGKIEVPSKSPSSGRGCLWEEPPPGAVLRAAGPPGRGGDGASTG